MKLKPLGKGLQALFEESSLSDFIDPGKKFLEIPVDKIEPNSLQPRENLDKENFESLKYSIREHGLIQPIAVRQLGDHYEIIAGERRWRALKELKWNTIPAYILQIEDERNLLEISMLENIHRSDLNPIEIAQGYHRLQIDFGLTQHQISETFSVDRSTVANIIRLLKLPKEIQQSVIDGTISAGHARALIALKSESEQRRLWKRILKEDLSVRQVEELLKQVSKKESSPTRKTDTKKSALIAQLEERLRHALGSQVRIKTGKSGGKIEIEFYSNEDLDRLIEIFAIIEKKY